MNFEEKLKMFGIGAIVTSLTGIICTAIITGNAKEKEQIIKDNDLERVEIERQKNDLSLSYIKCKETKEKLEKRELDLKSKEVDLKERENHVKVCEQNLECSIRDMKNYIKYELKEKKEE